MPEITDESAAKLMWSNLKAQALGVAQLRGPAPKQKELTPEEELLLFNTPAKSWTPEQEIALLAEGKSRIEVGMLKYPNRLKLAKRGPRALSKYEQAKYLADMAKKSDPSWTPHSAKLVRPPDPSETPAPETGALPDG